MRGKTARKIRHWAKEGEWLPSEYRQVKKYWSRLRHRSRGLWKIIDNKLEIK